MADTAPAILENSSLRVEVDHHDLAAHVTVKSTGEVLRMAGAQPDDVVMIRGQTPEPRSFTDSPIAIHREGDHALEARLPALGLLVRISLQDADVIFEVAPSHQRSTEVARDVLWPRHFLLPRRADAYATFPLGQGSIIPATEPTLFHHREGYAEATAHWLGGYTGVTGYVGIAETPDDLYQAVDNRADSPASCFFHWTGSLGELRYPRRARYRFAAGLNYVAQAKAYREHCKKTGLFRSLEDKAAENPNVRQLIGAPLVTGLASIRREKSFQYVVNPFADLAGWVADFHRRTGLAHALVHIDGWGYWGYDSMHPDALPPNPDCGGAEGLANLARRVKDLGYLFALHDQYIDMYAHAPSYDEGLSTVTQDGRPVRVNRWAGGLCGHMCYSQIPRFLRRNLFEGVRRLYPMYHNSPSVFQIAAPTAYYLDCFCRTVECYSEQHPLTRTQSRQRQNEVFRIARDGQSGQRLVLTVEHPRDFAIPYIESAWSNGHFTADVQTTAGGSDYRAVGVPVPLWHLVFHDALHLPTPGGDLLEALLYGQVPYFRLDGKPIEETELRIKKTILAVHEDVAFAEMTDHQIFSADGAAKCVFAGGLEVQVDRAENTYCISAGRARTAGTQRL